MKPTEITKFNQFLQDKGIETVFRSMFFMYNQNMKFSTYLHGVESTYAFSKAFRYSDAERNSCIKQFEWKRFEMEWRKIVDIMDLQKKIGEEHANQPKEELPEPEEETIDIEDELEDVSCVRLLLHRKKLAVDEISVHLMKSSNRLILNSYLSDELYEKGLFGMHLKKSKSGELYIIFSKTADIIVSPSDRKPNHTFRYNSKELVRYIQTTLGFNGKKTLKIKKMESKTPFLYKILG